MLGSYCLCKYFATCMNNIYLLHKEFIFIPLYSISRNLWEYTVYNLGNVVILVDFEINED